MLFERYIPRREKDTRGVAIWRALVIITRACVLPEPTIGQWQGRKCLRCDP